MYEYVLSFVSRYFTSMLNINTYTCNSSVIDDINNFITFCPNKMVI